MLFIYSGLLFLLGLVLRLLRWRARRLEKTYVRLADDADALLRQSTLREGNGNRLDPYQTAKRQYRLGLMAQKRDAAEDKYLVWQSRADRFAALRAGLAAWKGRALPYTFGAVDVAMVLSLIEMLALGQPVSFRTVAEYVQAWLTK